MSIIRNQRDKELRKLRAKGYTLEEIGVRFNLTRQRVHQILNKTLSTGALQTLDKK